MLKCLAIVGLFVLVGVCSGQNTPPNTPKEGITKSDSGGKGQKQPQAQPDNQSSPSSVTTTPQPTAPTCDESCQNTRKNLQIQNRLVWLTGGLVVVGLLQVGSMIWQAIRISQTRDDVHTQAGWLEVQTGRMSRQADLMNRQNAIAISSARTAKEAADAAKSSADATLAQVQAMKAKERARVWIELGDKLNLGRGPFAVPATYAVSQTGSTDALVIESFAIIVVLGTEPDFPSSLGMREISIPQRLPPGFEKKIESSFLHQFTAEEVRQIETK